MIFSPSNIFGIVAGLVLLAAPASAGELGGINMVNACHQQYGDMWGAAHDGTGAYDWYCVNSVNGNTAGVDLNAYCAKTYRECAHAVSNGGLWDWTCNN